jgi:hypothetical protein
MMMRWKWRNSDRARRNVSAGLCVWVAGFTLLLSGSMASTAARPKDSPSARALLSQQENLLTQYRAYRRMHAKSERFNQEGWVEVWTEMNGLSFTYDIVRAEGSDYILNKVLKTLLKREQEIVSGGQTGRAALSDANYEFTEPDRHGEGVRYVLLKPKRKDVLLVDGRMVLSQDGGELLRVEGRLSKNPSFWTSSVNVIRHFATLDGVRVPISVETIAKVKIAGRSRMEVSYEYESINGRPVSLSARRTMAAAIGR